MSISAKDLYKFPKHIQDQIRNQNVSIHEPDIEEPPERLRKPNRTQKKKVSKYDEKDDSFIVSFKDRIWKKGKKGAGDEA